MSDRKNEMERKWNTFVSPSLQKVACVAFVLQGFGHCFMTNLAFVTKGRICFCRVSAYSIFIMFLRWTFWVSYCKLIDLLEDAMVVA